MMITDYRILTELHQIQKKRDATISKYEMINIHDFANENKTEHNPKRPNIPDHPYRISIIGGSRFGKANAILNLNNSQPNTPKIYINGKDAYEAKQQYLINVKKSFKSL